ncbi:MAG: M56 family metallopeptidase, partial [Intestinibacter sp.]
MDIDFGYLIFQYLFISGVYGAAVGIIILIARQILKNKISKKYLCAIWLIFIFKLIIPYGLASDFSLFNKIPLLKDNTYITFDNIFYKADDNEVYGVDNLNNYEDLGKNKAVENTQNNKENSYKNFEDNIISNNNNTYYDEEEMSRFDVVDFIIVVEILMILVYMFVYFKFNKKLILYQQKSNRLEKIFKDTLKKMDINKKIELIITDSVNSPSLIGIFKIKVLIPSNLIDLEDFQLEYIFLHELCHYKRKDNIINYLLVVLQCLHLTNIVVWILFKKIRNDIELACDEKVLSILNEEDHDKYGLTILDVLEKINSNNKMIVGLSMISDKKVIKSRLEIIKKFKHLEHKKILALAGIASILVLGSALLTNNRIIADQKVLEGRYVNQLLEHKANYIKSKHEIEFLLHDINCTHNNYGNCSIGLYPINSIKFIDKKDHSSFMIAYETNYVDLSDMENNLYKNSAIIFSLIKN